MSLDLVSCKVTEQRLELVGIARWTMIVEGSCGAMLARVTVRGEVTERYPQQCNAQPVSAEMLLTTDASSITLSSHNAGASCIVDPGPTPHPSDGGASGTPWPTFVAIVTVSDGTGKHTVAYRPPLPPRGPVDPNVDGGVSPPKP